MAQKSQYKTENLAQVNSFLADINLYALDENTTTIYGKLKAEVINKFGPKEKAKRGIQNSKFKIQNYNFQEFISFCIFLADNNISLTSAVLGCILSSLRRIS